MAVMWSDNYSLSNYPLGAIYYYFLGDLQRKRLIKNEGAKLLKLSGGV